MAILPFTHEKIKLPSGLELEVTLSIPQQNINEESLVKLAVCLHPWSWLGGRMDDPVLCSIQDPFLQQGYHVLRYNSRGVGQSSGWPSLTGSQEAQDLQKLVQWALHEIPSISTVVILGYSHGSLIASLFPILPDPVKVYHILLSYPLGPRSWLTAFRGNMYATTLNNLLSNKRADVLVVFGDHDEFTGEESYDTWAEDLKRQVQGEGKGHLQIVKVEGATHFWTDHLGARSRMLRSILLHIP
ncbi:alpha/beta-hydrolase [Abortiporus biennis]|nr:alpha/beta-hydrolase [Abortiporus biennis]